MDRSWCSTFFEALDGTAYDEVKQLCFSLGYKELSAGLPSRGESNVLLNDLKGIAELVEQLILILLQTGADYPSPAQGLVPAKEKLNHQGLAGEPLLSGRTDKEVKSKGIVEAEAEQDDVLHNMSGKTTSQGFLRGIIPDNNSGYPVATPFASNPARTIKLEDAGDTGQWLAEPADRSQISYGSSSVNQRPIPVKAAGPLDTIENCEIQGPESELDDYIPEHELSSDSSDQCASRKLRTPTPPLSSLDTIKRTHWPRQHPGTPPPIPARNKLATPSASPCSSQSNRKLPVLFPNLKSSNSSTPTILGCRKRRLSDIGVSHPPSSKRQSIAITDDEFWREKTPPRRIKIDLKVTPLTPPSPEKKPKVMKPTRELEARPVNFQFSLGDAALGVISKGFERCSTFEAFNEEAALAAGYLSRATFEVEPDLLVADIDGGERALAVGWKQKHSYEKLCVAIGQAARTGQGPMSVRIYCLRKGTDDLQMPPFFA